MREDVLERMRRLRLMIFDVDGVLTDGTLYFSETGAELKAFNARDGHGLKMLRESGVEVAILSARRSRAVEVRAAELGITLVEQGAADMSADDHRKCDAQRGVGREELIREGAILPPDRRKREDPEYCDRRPVGRGRDPSEDRLDDQHGIERPMHESGAQPLHERNVRRQRQRRMRDPIGQA